MQQTQLADLTDSYDHIYLSPHLDDAVLSCGGSIINQRSRGERVLVITLCTAAPPPEGPFSELAQEFHQFWALPPEQVVAARLEEDAAAMARIGADYIWAGFLDAIYRRPDAYTTRESLFGTPVADDPLRPALENYIAEVRRRAPSAALYAPLGVGFHVDHQITHSAALAIAGDALTLYEDFPYAMYAGAVETRQSALTTPFQPHVVAIDTTLAPKIEAIAAYSSQIDELFRTEPMPQAVRAYHTRIAGAHGAAERIWRGSPAPQTYRVPQ